MSERVDTGLVLGDGCRNVATNVLDLSVTMSAMFNHNAHSNTGTVVSATSRAKICDLVRSRASLVLEVSAANTMCHVFLYEHASHAQRQSVPSAVLGDNRPDTEFNGDNPRVGLYLEVFRRGIVVDQEQDLSSGSLSWRHHRPLHIAC